MDRKAFGEILKSRRKSLKKTLIEFQQETGLSKSYFSSIEKGGVEKPKPPSLKLIAQAYEIELEKVRAVFKKELKEADKITHMDSILMQIASDETLPDRIRKLMLNAIKDGMSTSQKMFCIRFYEHYKGVKLLP